ncbi:MAG TPA: SDR family NAD(P)-dependent oxidoreductase, partial [Mycobacteriales bacterium]|nr:SDR family NAD(P)-dependent oxidoreductase [Mycobacteriales bacterium]
GDANAQVAEELRSQGAAVTALTVDVGDGTAVQQAAAAVLAEHRRVDVLFNNAGVMNLSTVEGTSEEEWDAEMNVNLTSVFRCSRAFLPGLKESGSGAIVNNASVDGVLGNPGLILYSTAKAGMIGLTRVMASEFAAYGIRVNCVAPALIEFPEMTTTTPEMERAFDHLIRNTPMRRKGQPDEVARTVLFFATEDSSYVTGAMLPVDGGRIQLTPGTIPMGEM